MTILVKVLVWINVFIFLSTYRPRSKAAGSYGNSNILRIVKHFPKRLPHFTALLSMHVLWCHASVRVVKGSAVFPRGFPTRLSHEAFTQGCPTCHLCVSRSRLESRGSAGKTVFPGMDWDIWGSLGMVARPWSSSRCYRKINFILKTHTPTITALATTILSLFLTCISHFSEKSTTSEFDWFFFFRLFGWLSVIGVV